MDRSTENLIPLIAENDTQAIDLAATLLEVQLSMSLTQDAERTFAALPSNSYLHHPRLCLLSVRLLTEKSELEAARSRLNDCQPESIEENKLALLVKARLEDKAYNYVLASKLYAELFAATSAHDPNWAYITEQYCLTLSGSGQLAEALDVHSKAVSLATRSFPKNHISLIRLDLIKLRIDEANGNSAAVVRFGPDLAEAIRNKFGERSLVAARTDTVIARNLLVTKRAKESLFYYERALRSFDSVLGPNHQATLGAAVNLTAAKASAGVPMVELMDEYEDLVARSAAYAPPGLHAYIQIMYGYHLAKAGMTEAALRVFSRIDARAAKKAVLEARERYLDWLNYAYWSEGCAAGAEQFHTRDIACTSAPKFSSICQAARESLCGLASDPFERVFELPTH